MIQHTSDRRRFLKFLGAGAIGATLGVTPGRGGRARADVPSPAPASATRKRLLRVAHLTDIHVQPELGAAEGLAACLRHVQGRRDPPQLLLNTGDCIMDAMKRDRARTELQWKTWDSVWRAECSLPMKHALGNHDIWGWNKNKSNTAGNEPGWGKQWALDALKMERAYHSFDVAGWHFVALDSVQPLEDRYTAYLDEAQYAWLASDLAAVGRDTPVLVMSHIPIFTVTPLVVPKADDGGDFRIGKAAMHGDFQRIRALFKKHPNVKAAVSGHMHLVDRVEYGGVSYLCGGAVSGDWWKGSRLGECDPGYAMLNLYDDGSVEREYVPYGWAARTDDGAVPAGAAEKTPA